MGLAANPDGSLWVGLGFPGPGLGLQQLLRGVLKPFVTPDFDGSTLAVSTLFLDRKNTLWVGTFNGMYRVHERQVDSFRSVDGLSGDIIRGFFKVVKAICGLRPRRALTCFEIFHCPPSES